MIDKKAFIETFSVFDREVVVEIINIFFEEYPERFVKLDQNIIDGNYKDLAFNAHSLKGVVANFAAQLAYEAAKDMENTAIAIRDGNTDPALKIKVQEMYPQLKQATAEVCDDLRELIKLYL